jgi:hypothetical protein
MDVFFVNTAKDMCEVSQAGVVSGSYDPYLAAYPETARILNDMAKPVGSLLASPYWSGLPFVFGLDRMIWFAKGSARLFAPLDVGRAPILRSSPTARTPCG